MSDAIFKKSFLYRFSGFLLLIPFIPAVRPIIEKHTTADLIIITCGFSLTVLLILFSNNKTYIKITEDKLIISLMYRHKPEIHHISSIEKIVQNSQKKITIKTKGFDSLEIRLNKKEILTFLEKMDEKDVPISKAYRS